MGPLLILLLGTQIHGSHFWTTEHPILAISTQQLPEGWCPGLSGHHPLAGTPATL